MKPFERLHRWASTIENIEDQADAELRWLWVRIQFSNDRHSAPLLADKRGAL